MSDSKPFTARSQAHPRPEPQDGALEIALFPCLSDNYGFLIHDPITKRTATIDTPDGAEIKKQCEARGWTLTEIWNTHHHFDHVGGNDYLSQAFDLEIIGHEKDGSRIPNLTRGLNEGDSFQFGSHAVQVLETYGHTIGHIIYYVPSAKAAFVGDTIFVMGCGRLFEGSPAQMFDSLSKISALPDDTALYCAHEYTLSNGKFAQTIEPDNSDLAAYIETAKGLRDKNIPTVPTTVAREKAINPFLRAKTAERLGEIRAAKDKF